MPLASLKKIVRASFRTEIFQQNLVDEYHSLQLKKKVGNVQPGNTSDLI